MRYSTTPLPLNLGAGVLIGFGLSGCSFNLVLSAFSKLLPPERRGFALGAGTAAGSFGQFLFAPFGVAHDRQFRLADGADGLCGADAADPAVIACAAHAAGRTTQRESEADQQSFRTALAEAFGHRSYVLLVLGFFTCGFQLAFITVHLPPYLVDRGIPAQTGGWVMAAIGLFNIIGSLSVGCAAKHRAETLHFVDDLSDPRDLDHCLHLVPDQYASRRSLFSGAISGLTWLSTVPPTTALVALMFGTRWFATLYGFAFVSHQVGGFLGVWLGGIVFDQFGSYTPIWWLSVLFGVLSALINLPDIVEKPVARLVANRPEPVNIARNRDKVPEPCRGNI